MKPTRKLAVVAFAVSLGLTGPAAFAGPFTDDLSKCMVRSTTSADKSLLVQWMFAMMALHPDVKWLTSASDAQRLELNKKTAGMFEQLLTGSCVKEAREALKYEGAIAMETSFSVLGQVAAEELFANPSVAGGVAGLEQHLDLEKLGKALEINP